MESMDASRVPRNTALPLEGAAGPLLLRTDLRAFCARHPQSAVVEVVLFVW